MAVLGWAGPGLNPFFGYGSAQGTAEERCLLCGSERLWIPAALGPDAPLPAPASSERSGLPEDTGHQPHSEV